MRPVGCTPSLFLVECSLYQTSTALVTRRNHCRHCGVCQKNAWWGTSEDTKGKFQNLQGQEEIRGGSCRSATRAHWHPTVRPCRVATASARNHPLIRADQCGGPRRGTILQWSTP